MNDRTCIQKNTNTPSENGNNSISSFIKFLLLVVSVSLSPNRFSFGQSDSIDIYELDFHQLSKVKIVSAAKVEQNIIEVPATILIITKEEIKENGYFTLEEALSSLPGFQFRNIQGMNSYIFQRGIPNQNNLTLILIDGIQINELNSGGFYAGGQYNLSNVERIEVVYGPASVVYGTNAVSGIINIITKSAMDGRKNVQFSVGNFNTLHSNFSYSFVNEDRAFAVALSGMYKQSDKLNLKDAEGDYNWSNDLDNYENDYALDLKIESGNFVFGTNFMQKKTTTSTMWKTTGTIYKDNGTLWNIRFINSYLKYNKTISEGLTLSSILYNRNSTVLDNSVYQVVDTAQVGYYRPNNLTGLEAILNYKMNESFSLTSGLTLEYESLAKGYSVTYSNSPSEKPPAPGKPDMLNNKLASVFVEPRFSPFENFLITCGFRFDHSTVYDEIVTPRAGISYNFDNHVFYLSYSEAFRAPKPWDYTDGLGNPSLLPERMKSIESSVSFFVTNGLKINFTGYINTLKNAFVKEQSSTGYKWVNSGEANTKGVECALKYANKSFKSVVNYTYTQSYNELENFIPEISKHTINAGITYSFCDYFIVNFRANYIGRRENPKLISAIDDRYLKPCTVFHAAITMMKYKNFDAQLSVKNIFDEEYYHTSNRDPDRYRQPQRTFIFSVGYSINN